MYNSTKEPKVGVRMARIKTTAINLRAKKPGGVSRTEYRVGADVGIMRGNVNVPYMFASIKVCTNQRLEDIHMASKEHNPIPHYICHHAEIISL
jgi:hypothetical protein